ncbi:MAG: polyphosphate:AMP phosphotransferase [Clostridiales bacterium]|nr:polyphosphate:AMP phosphotransferase [Clostridiales bacterium]
MLKEWSKGTKPDGEELDRRLEEARAQLAARQTVIKEKKLPVLVILEGWGAAGKGSVLGRVIRNMDPRFFKVDVGKEPTEDEQRRPFLYRHFVKIPEAGKFSFLVGSWMKEVTKGLVQGELDEKAYNNRLASIKCFERQLTDNGYLVLKFFFHIDEKEQKKRLEELLEDKHTKWRVSEADLSQNRNYKKWEKAYDGYMEQTNQSSAPWYLIDSKNKKWAELQMLEFMVRGIDTALMNQSQAVPLLQNHFPLKTIPKLSEISLKDKVLEEKEYREELKICQKRLSELHNELYHKKLPVIIAYEGWDAAGKGGNIKRIAAALDPRGYEVHPIASPEPHEKARHYLWRFWNRLPKDGHIAIFDRTWYGRVMVERLEGFCSENDWQRAYNEINEFEKELADWGAVVIKFWVQIDKDTQLERFTLRQNTPEKRWKITDEDWRNREKWDLYEEAVNEMLQKTNTAYAPWHVLESNDKKYARVKALKTVIAAIEEKL